MFKFRFFSLVVISMMLIVGLAASSVLAKPSGIKVDSDESCNADREDNEICNTSGIWVWLNINTNSPLSDCKDGACTLCFELIRHSDGGTECSDGLDFAADQCPDRRPTYLIVDLIDECGGLPDDLYTLIVDDCGNPAKTIGADSFSVEPCP